MSQEPLYPIRLVARRTGLSTHVIRVWERRYGAVSPDRTESNRRLYSDEDIYRLSLLHSAVRAGHSIKSIATLPQNRLEELLPETSRHVPSARKAGKEEGSVEGLLRMSLDAVRRLEPGQLQVCMDRAMMELGRRRALIEVIAPLMQGIGDLWHDGELRVLHEHTASVVVRSFLGSMVFLQHNAAPAPLLVSATLEGEFHEFGALLVAAMAYTEGWRVAYLGPGLPVEEIAAGVRDMGASVLALSLVYHGDESYRNEQLFRLGKYITNGTRVIVGGRASAVYEEAVTAIGAKRIPGLEMLGMELGSSRLRQKIES